MIATSTVLVVDDTPANLGVVLDLLGASGLRVLIAESGARALELLAQQPVHVVLLDMIMPGLDGFATCALIKANPAWADIPVLFLTAVDDPTVKVRSLEAGAVDYVNKPLHAPEVLARVRTHLELCNARRALQRQNERLEAEITLRLDAEAQLAQSLDRALLVADMEGRVLFQTLRASTLLHKHLPSHRPGWLPLELKSTDRLESMAGVLLVRHFSESDNATFTVLYLVEEDEPPGPAQLMQLGLTPRQAEVLYWIAQGKTNAEIAIILGNSPRTIHKHVESLLDRLGVSNRTGAISMATNILRPV